MKEKIKNKLKERKRRLDGIGIPFNGIKKEKVFSEYVLLKNTLSFYKDKEPFEGSGLSIKGGLEYDEADDTIKCHECGYWFKSLAPHLHMFHGMSVADYKKAHGLSSSTALISEG